MPGGYVYGWDDAAQEWVKVACTANGKLLIDPSGFLENPPTEDQDKKAPTSEWAYDHWKDASAHHARYTDQEACDAWKERSTTVTNGTYDNLDLDDYNLVYLDTSSGNIILRGIKPGYNGKRIRFFKVATSNEAFLYHNHASGVANGKIFTSNYSTQRTGTIYTVGFELIYYGNYWRQTCMLIYRSNDLFDDTPGNGDLAKGPTSNWAYDHENNVSAHHARYTDAEAVGSFYNRFKTLTDGTYTDESLDGISMLMLNTGSGDINLKGLSDGVSGQIVICFKNSQSNDVNIYNNSGDAAAGDKIFTFSNTDESIVGNDRGGFILIYYSAQWYIIDKLT